MGDIIDLAIKEFEGKLRSDEGRLTVIGDLVSLEANTGKDMYIARAKVNWRAVEGGTTLTIELKLNNVVIETYSPRIASVSVQDNTFETYEFKNTSGKVLAGETIKIEIIDISSTSVEGFIECFEEDTGESPAIT